MIYLAIKMLVGDRTKYFGVIVGVLFTTFLMAHLLSMFSGLIVRTYALIVDIPEADVWVMDPAVEYVDEIASLPSTAVDRTRSVEGVDWAVPIFTGTLRVRMLSGQFRAVEVIGIDDATLIGAPRDMIEGSPEDLRRADAVIADRTSADAMLRQPLTAASRGVPDGNVPTRPLAVGDELTINDHRVVVEGFARITPRFLLRPTMYMTYSHATSISPPERNLLSFVIVHAKAGAAPAELARRIEAETGFRARTAAEFRSDTAWYVSINGGVVIRIGLMVGIATMVGIVMTALLLYLFTVENLRYYATLKALGAVNGKIVTMVAAQALACGVTGFSLGIGASAMLGLMMNRVNQPYLLIWPTIIATGLVVLFVCLCAGTLSSLKVIRLEPGIVFRG